MFRNRISRFYEDWVADTQIEVTAPPGFTRVPMHELPPGVQKMVQCQQPLYQLAYAKAQIAGIDADWFSC